MADPSRIVVLAPNWLGDAVMALPALEAVRQAFAGRTIVLAGLPSIVPIFEERTGAAPDEILSIVSDCASRASGSSSSTSSSSSDNFSS